MPNSKKPKTLEIDPYARSQIDVAKRLISQQLDVLVNCLLQAVLDGRIRKASCAAGIDPEERKDEGAVATERTSTEPQQLLTVAELAERWQVSARTIRREIKRGKIRVVRIGRSVRISPEEPKK
jgi:excisionase family DNA binding protein